MSIINFPQNPTLYELYPFGGKTWQWNGSYWGIYSGTSLSIVDINYSASTGELWYTKSDLSQNNTSKWSYFTGGSYDTSTREITLSANTGGTFTISNLDYNGVTNLDFNVANYDLTIQRPSGNDTVSLSILATDMTVTGGTYNSSNGVVTFINNSGGTFEVSGFTSGYTDIRTTGVTYTPSTGLLTFNTTTTQNAYSANTAYYVSGTTNYIPKFNSTGITNSQIFDDGTLVTIGYGNNTVTNTELLVSGYTKLGQSLSSTASKTLMIGGNMSMEQVAGPTGPQLTGITFTSNASSGNLSAGTYQYDICFITAEGETECVVSSFYQASGLSLSNGSSMTLNNIPTSSDPRVTGRRIFRTRVNPSQAGSGLYFCYSIATINDNTTTTYVDTFSDSSINTSTSRVNYRKGNTTAGQIFIRQGTVDTRSLYSDEYDTVFGVGAYSNNIAGNSNVAIGGVSLRDNTTGVNSVSIGYASSFRATGGSDNTVIGYAANYVNPGGSNNVAIGSGTLRGSTLTDQSFNTAVGTESMIQSSGSSYTSTLGYRAGRLFYGNYNVFIGQNTAAYSTARGGNYNIFIGNTVGTSMTGTSNMNNNILIGYGVNAPNLGGSNQLNIGNLLYSDSIGNSSTSATGGLGIGVTVPGARLDVSPTSSQIGTRISGSSSTDMVRITQTGSGSALRVEDEGNPDGSPFLVASDGKVYIGTTDVTTSVLNVSGNTLIYGNILINGTSNRVIRNSVDGRALINFATNGDSYLNNGNFGIGLTGATSRLHVVGNTNLSGVLFVGDTNSTGGILNARFNSPLSGGATVTSVFHSPQVQTGVTTVYGIRSQSILAANASISSYYHFSAAEGTWNAGSSISQNFGFVIGSDFNRGTTNVAFYGALTASSSNWNVYMPGTAANYLQGDLRIGTATNNGYKLDVVGTGRTSNLIVTNDIGVGTTSPDSKSILDLTSTTKGFLPPRMTNVQITGITSPPEGLVIYSTDAKTLVFYNGTSWQKVTTTAL
jgi:hypothetical protein